jgi:hypothetical protein
MNAIRRPLFLVDVEETADYLFTEAGEATALRWKDSLKRTLVLLREFPEKGFSQLACVLSHCRQSH